MPDPKEILRRLILIDPEAPGAVALLRAEVMELARYATEDSQPAVAVLPLLSEAAVLFAYAAFTKLRDELERQGRRNKDKVSESAFKLMAARSSIAALIAVMPAQVADDLGLDVLATDPAEAFTSGRKMSK